MRCNFHKLSRNLVDVYQKILNLSGFSHNWGDFLYPIYKLKYF